MKITVVGRKNLALKNRSLDLSKIVYGKLRADTVFDFCMSNSEALIFVDDCGVDQKLLDSRGQIPNIYVFTKVHLMEEFKSTQPEFIQSKHIKSSWRSFARGASVWFYYDGDSARKIDVYSKVEFNEPSYRSPLVLGRRDLNRNSLTKNMKDLTPCDFKSDIGYKAFAMADVVVFIDDNGSSNVLKNRYGYEQKVCPSVSDDLTICVMAGCGKGKTTTAVLIKNLLKSIGIESVEIEDVPGEPVLSAEKAIDRAPNLRNTLKKVKIKTIQTRR